MTQVANRHLKTTQITSVSIDIINQMVTNALEEDIQTGDITAELVAETTKAKAYVMTRETMILCGKAWVEETFRQIDPSIKLHWYFNDGDLVKEESILFEAFGNARDLLTAERTAMNFLQTLSAVATITFSFVEKIKHTKAKILDTRKTIPGFRLAQKYAVTCGGGTNHRIGLFDAFLIKENHIASSGGIIEAVLSAHKIAPGKFVEVEVENMIELNEAINAGADVIMLDNFNLDQMKEAVEYVNGKVALEASGNVDLHSIVAIAETGVDFISIGGITKNIQAIDLSMRFV